jgi:hypothetical protein
MRLSIPLAIAWATLAVACSALVGFPDVPTPVDGGVDASVPNVGPDASEGGAPGDGTVDSRGDGSNAPSDGSLDVGTGVVAAVCTDGSTPVCTPGDRCHADCSILSCDACGQWPGTCGGACAPVTFGYTDGAQELVVPTGVTQITITAEGGSGSIWAVGGASVTATVAVTPGETLAIYVGGAGADPKGGFNGGGAGGTGAVGTGGGGGGASDVREGGSALSNRIVVAAGGGGTAGNGGGAGGATMGAAGGDGASSSIAGGGGGTQSAGGTSNATPGILGFGGAGGSPPPETGAGGGGGGGGYYGGGGGAANPSVAGGLAGGGGGGSSYVEPSATAVTVTPGVQQTGNGRIVITY